METVIFYILSAIILVFSILTISSNNILRAVVYLLFVLCATAGIYFMVNFNFLAAVQLTVYAGGIVVLIIFSILLTQQINTTLEPASKKKKIMVGSTIFLSGCVFLWAVLSFPFQSSNQEISDSSMTAIGMQLMNFRENGYVLPFEVISILLLAIMVAAIIIAKNFTDD